MSDLWPDFNDIEQEEKNNAIHIIREQARALGKKLNNKIKATFSKVSYSKTTTGFETALNVMATITAATKPNMQEVLEEDLQGKTNLADLLTNEKYKFEIYNNSYRFRLFVYNYTLLYPNSILIDENIAKELGKNMNITIESNQELSNLLQDIFSSQRVRKIIGMMLDHTVGEG